MIELAIPARRHSIGAFEVGRVLPHARRRMVGPFIFFDHIGPHTLAAPIAPEADVRPHPHIGLATVTYLFDGEMTHRDSTGVTQDIRPGAVNWMNAGRGITHSERFDGMRARGGALHGVQAWVALPDAQEDSGPAFDHYPAESLPRFDEPGVRGRLIAGEAFGAKSAVKTHSPLHYAHVELEEGASLAPPRGQSERAVFVAAGAVMCDGARYEKGQMLVFGAAAAPKIMAESAATLMFVGGEPVGERHIYWNFVASTKDRIEAAKADWRAGRFALPPNDSADFIPLPPE